MEKRTFKTIMYNQIGEIAKAMANAHRLEILDLLANGPKAVEQIAGETALSVANASQHLQVLRGMRLVNKERRGNYVYYQLSGPEVYKAWRSLRDLALGQSAEMKLILSEYRHVMDSRESLTLESLFKQKDPFILDVRPEEEFESGHIEGARNIPIRELADRLGELPLHQLIVAYCRGPFCTYADEAVKLLKENGFRVVRLEENAIDFQLIT